MKQIGKWISWPFRFLKLLVKRIRKIIYPQWQVFFQGREITSFSRLQETKKNLTTMLNAKGSASWKKSYFVWWDHHSIIQWEFLNHRLNTNLYIQQLQHVHENLIKFSAPVNKRNMLLDNKTIFNKNYTGKILDLGYCFTQSTIVTRTWTIFLLSTKCSEWQNSQDQVKTIVEHLSSKPAEFS